MIFTDGACLGNGKKNAIGGIGIYFGADDARNVSRKYVGDLSCEGFPELRVTNQTMELLAAVVALRISPGEPLIVTDSMYMVKCMGTWVKAWKKNGWKNRFGEEVKNRSLLLELSRLSTGTTFEHQLAHQMRPDTNSNLNAIRRHEGNAAADGLAALAVRRNPMYRFMT